MRNFEYWFRNVSIISKLVCKVKKRNLRIYSVDFFKAFSKKKVFGGPYIYHLIKWTLSSKIFKSFAKFRKMLQFLVCTTIRCRLVFVLFANIIISLCANIGQLMLVLWFKCEIDTFSNKQPRFIKNFENFGTECSIEWYLWNKKV